MPPNTSATITKKGVIPKHFVSIQEELGLNCDNYYFGDGGERIGLTVEELAGFGLLDGTMWVHPDVIAPLNTAANLIWELDYKIQIRDAWRPAGLYDLIVEKMLAKEQNSERSRINDTDKPHATGMAIDVVLVDLETEKVVWTRNQEQDGDDCCIYGYYSTLKDDESRLYQELQDILVESFLRSGFLLGSKQEYWHFELPGTKTAERF